MKKKFCLIFIFLFVLGTVSCSRAEARYDYIALTGGSFCALVCGEWNGVSVEAKVEVESGEGARDFYVRFLSDSLSEVIVRREGGKVMISRGGIEERDFYMGGLCELAELFFPDSAGFLREEICEGEARGVLSAALGDRTYEITVREGGVPLKIEGGGFSLSVKEFAAVK